MLCAQTLQAVRNELTQAFNIDAFTRGQLDFDASMISNTHKRVVRRDVDTNEVIYSEPVRGSQSQGFKRSSCPLPSNIFFLTKVTRAAQALSSPSSALAHYTYSESTNWKSTEIVAAAVWSKYLAAQNKKLRSKKLETLKSMVFLAMQNWRSVTRYQKELHGPSRVRELLAVNEHHWHRDWQPHWKLMHEILDGFDQRILTEIYNATK